MPLRLVAATSCLHAYRDASGEVLLLELEGQLTRVEAQAIRVQVAQLAWHRRHSQVLINAGNLSFSKDGSLHLFVQLLLRELNLLGIHQLAWVCRSSLHSLTAAHLLLTRLSIPASLFADVEHAATWLRNYPAPAKQDRLLLAPATQGITPVALS